LAGRSLQKLSRQSKVNLRADKITAVPFVPPTFCEVSCLSSVTST
jgi:hypothetical protein